MPARRTRRGFRVLAKVRRTSHAIAGLSSTTPGVLDLRTLADATLMGRDFSGTGCTPVADRVRTKGNRKKIEREHRPFRARFWCCSPELQGAKRMLLSIIGRRPAWDHLVKLRAHNNLSLHSQYEMFHRCADNLKKTKNRGGGHRFSQVQVNEQFNP